MNENRLLVLPAGKLIERAGRAHRYQIRCLILFSFQWAVASMIFNGYDYLFQTPPIICSNRETKAFICTEAQACSKQYHYEFDPKGAQTLVSQFHLICEKDYLVELSQIAFFLGAFFGSYYYSEIQNRKGRLWTMTQTTSLIGFLFMGSVLSFWIYINLGIIFMANFALFALLSTTIVYFSEITSDNMRVTAPGVFLMSWAGGSIIMSSIISHNPNWKILSFVCMGLPMFCLAFFYRFMKDSPRFLVIQEKYDEAKASINNIAKINQRKLPEYGFENEYNHILYGKTYDLEIETEAEQNKKKTKTFLTLFQYKSLTRISVILILYRTMLTIANHGNPLALNTFGPNLSKSLLTDGVIELFGYGLANYYSLKLRRRDIFKLVFQLMAGVYAALFVVGVKPTEVDVDKSPGIVVAIVVVGRWTVCVGFACLYVYICEVIPTTVRHFSFGINTSLSYFALFIFSRIDDQIKVGHNSILLFIGILFFILSRLSEELEETFRQSIYDEIREEDDFYLMNLELYHM